MRKRRGGEYQYSKSDVSVIIRRVSSHFQYLWFKSPLVSLVFLCERSDVHFLTIKCFPVRTEHTLDDPKVKINTVVDSSLNLFISHLSPTHLSWICLVSTFCMSPRVWVI